MEMNTNPKASFFFDACEDKTRLTVFGMTLTDSNNTVVDVPFNDLESLHGMIRAMLELNDALETIKSNGIKQYLDRSDTVNGDFDPNCVEWE